MSKEERIQEIRELEIADRLGISLGYLKDPLTTAISAEAAMKIWSALVAAETKLEPQTVAETIDFHEISEVIRLLMSTAYNEMVRLGDGESATNCKWCGEFSIMKTGKSSFEAKHEPGCLITRGMSAIEDLTRIHSPAADTKGLEK